MMASPACDDISGGLERTPVSFLNDVDAEDLPYFEYTTMNVPGSGSDEQAFSEVFTGCSCETACEGAQCPCLLRCQQPLLRGPAAALSVATVECSSVCACDPACQNRSLQRGLRCRLQVFKTRGKGFGVRTMDPVPQGGYVCPYAGEVISLDVARRRVEELDPAVDSNYVMVLRENGAVTLVVDPSRVGGVGRFLNHSCDPNLVMIPVRTECIVPELALFARRDICSGEELTYDYSDGSGSSSVVGKRRCFCGSKQCRGWLPFNQEVLGI